MSSHYSCGQVERPINFFRLSPNVIISHDNLEYAKQCWFLELTIQMMFTNESLILLYLAPKLRNWEAKEHLRPASTPTPTGNAITWKLRPTTSILVNDHGHLPANLRKPGSSFNIVPTSGSYGATKQRWPITKPHTAVPYAGRATFGYKGTHLFWGFGSVRR
jgi:hypothetical protein